MRTGLDWYKRKPVAYLGGVQGLTSKQHAVYSVILDLIYEHGGWVNNDPRWVSGWISDMGPAAVRNTILELVDLGKLIIEGDKITQHVARNEAETRGKQRENASVSGRIGGIQSGFSRRQSKENNDLNEANALSREDKRREEGSSGVVRAREDDPPPQIQQANHDLGEDAWALYRAVMKSVGVPEERMPAHWMPPSAVIRVQRWLGLGLSEVEIIETARHTRANFETPPNGPAALDGAMQRTAAAKQMPPMTVPEGQRPRLIGGNHVQQPGEDKRTTRADLIRAAARGTT